MNKVQKDCLRVLVEVDRICRKHDIKYSLTGGTLLGAVRHQGYIPWDDDIDIRMLQEDFPKFQKALTEEAQDKTTLASELFYQSESTEKNYLLLFPRVVDTSVSVKDLTHQHIELTLGAFVDLIPVNKVVKDEKEQIKLFDQILKYQSLILGLYWASPENTPAGNKQRIVKLLRALKLEKLTPIFRAILKKQAKIIDAADQKAIVATNGYYLYDRGLLTADKSTYKKALFKDNFMDNSIELDFEGYKFYGPKNYDEVLTNQYGDYMTLPPESERVGTHVQSLDE